MTGHVIAVGNMKGGVGKTAAVVALSQALAADAPGNRILVIDVDAQASASNCIAGDALHAGLIENGRTIDAFLEDLLLKEGAGKPIEHYVRAAVSRVMHKGNQLEIDLLAASPNLRGIERGLIHGLTRSGRDMAWIEREMCTILAGEIARLRQHYAYIVIDTAPGISLMTEALMRIADLVVVPVIPDYLSVLGLNAYRQNVWNSFADLDSRLPVPPRLPQVLISRFRVQMNMHARMVQHLREQAAAPNPAIALFAAKLPEAALVPAAIERTAIDFPLFLNLWGDLIPVLQSVVDEIKEALARPARGG